MQHTAFYSPLGPSDLDSDPVFNVVIAYEDFETGKHAKETYDFLVSHLGKECRFSNQMWKFDVLGIPKLREMAAKDALNGDIIIVSCHGAHPLPSEVKLWINSWMEMPGNAIALVALFGSGDACSAREQTRAYLAEVARCSRMEFFAQPSDFPNRALHETFADHGPTEKDNRTLRALAGVIQRDQSFPRWGINE